MQHNQATFEKAIALVEEGLRPYQIARKIDINPSTACTWVKKIKAGHKRIQQRQTDHTNAVYGEWTVIKELDRRPQYGSKADSGETIPNWEVKCSCGYKTEKTGTVLNQMKRKFEAYEKGEGKDSWRFHCDESPVHVMPCSIGEKLGDLEVVSFPLNTGQRKRYKTYKGKKPSYTKTGKWFIGCLCNACNKWTIKNPYLVTMKEWRERKDRLKKNKNAICACGCNRSVTHGLCRPQKDGRDQTFTYTMWQNAKKNARRKKVPFDLTPEFVASLEVPKYCPVLGIKIISQAIGEERNDNTPSLDKFYPKLGYVEGNVQIISWKANALKRDGSPEEWEKIAEWCKKEDIKKRLEGRHPEQQIKKES